MAKVNDTGISVSTKESPSAISDSGRVRIGNTSPAFPLVRPLVRTKPAPLSDSGGVRIGDYTASISLGSTTDEPKIRIARIFAPIRSS